MSKRSDVAAAMMLAHPLRVRILDAIENASSVLRGRPSMSPVELHRELGEPLSGVSYHVTVLARLGAIELVDTAPRRGAVEHYYALTGKVVAPPALSANQCRLAALAIEEILDGSPTLEDTTDSDWADLRAAQRILQGKAKA